MAINENYEIYQRADELSEGTVLASVMYDALANPQSGMADFLLSNLTQDCFTTPIYARVYNAIKAVRDEGLPADHAHIPVYLRESDHEQYSVLGGHTTTKNIEPMVKKLHALREARKALSLMNEAYKVYSDEENPVKMLAGMKKCFSEAISDTEIGADGGIMVKNYLGEYVKLKEERKNGAKKGIQTGIATYDKFTGGAHGGELIVIAALQKMGKTNFAISVAVNMDMQGEHVSFFTLEMGKEEMLDRIVSQRTAGNRELFQRSLKLGTELDQRDMARLNEVAGDMHNSSNMYMNTSGRTNLEDIKSILRRRKADGVLSCAFVDYLQLLVRDEHKAREEISNITRELKLLAKELNVPIFLLSQINNRDAKVGERPHKGQLKGSSSIESDADVILFPWREGAISNDPDADQTQATLIIGAIRGVHAKDIELSFSTDTTKFIDANMQEWR